MAADVPVAGCGDQPLERSVNQTRDERIEANLDLCRFHATWIYRRIRKRIPLEDLIQSGMMGLIKASDRFDPSNGAAFRTFADLRVKGAILDAIRSETKSRSSTRPKLLFTSLDDLKRAGFQVPDPDSSPDAGADLARVWQQLKRLPAHMQRIIKLYYGDADLTDIQIGKLLGLSPSRISQLRRQGIARLRRQKVAT